MFERDIMAIDFNTGKVNNTQSVNSTTGSATPSAGTTGNNNVELRVNNEVLERLKALGIDNPEDVYAILEKCQKENIDISNISDENLQAIVTEYNEAKAVKADKTDETEVAGDETTETTSATTSAKTETPDTETNTETSAKTETETDISAPKTNNTIQNKDFKAEYNKKDLQGKIEDCYTAIAENIYTNGFKDKSGKDILQPNSLGKSWSELSNDEQTQFINTVKNFIDNDERLKSVKEQFISTDKTPEEDKNKAIDALMRGILASQEIGISYTEYLKKNEFERAEIVENYLNFENTPLNDNDKYLLELNKSLEIQVSDILKEKYGIDIPADNLDIRDIGFYMKYLNLDKNELVFSHLKEKAENGNLSEDDKKLYDHLELLYNTDGGQYRLKTEKAERTQRLESEYEQLKSKPESELTPEERTALRLLKQTLEPPSGSAEEAELNELHDIIKNKPTPTSDEQKILEELESVRVGVNEQINSPEFEAKFLWNYIQNKSPEELEQYITMYCRFNHTPTANFLWLMAYKADDKILNKNTADIATLNYGGLNSKDRDKLDDINVELANSKNQHEREAGLANYNTTGDMLNSKQCQGAEFDTNKEKHVSNFHKINYEGKEEDRVKGSQTNFDITTTITNNDLQRDTAFELINGRNAKEADAEYWLNNSNKLHENNQAQVVNSITDKWASAAKIAASGDFISKFHESAQTDIFKGTHKAIDKWFEGEEAINYLNSLSDQIQYCDKSNQLDMHNDIMTSQYSEVIEHAASNIGNYDVSVRADAFESTIATGNTQAIENAYMSIASSPNAVQEAVRLQQVIEKSVEMPQEVAVSKTEELVNRLKSGENLSETELKALPDEYKAAYFKSLPPAKQVEIIAKISDVQAKKSIYKKLAQYAPNLLQSVIERDAAAAELVFDMDIANDIVVRACKNKGYLPAYAKLLNKIHVAERAKADSTSHDYKARERKNVTGTISPYRKIDDRNGKKGQYYWVS